MAYGVRGSFSTGKLCKILQDALSDQDDERQRERKEQCREQNAVDTQYRLLVKLHRIDGCQRRTGGAKIHKDTHLGIRIQWQWH